MLVYADASALVRLATELGAPGPLRLYLGPDAIIVTCRVAQTELRLAQASGSLEVEPDVLFRALAVRELDESLAKAAGEIRIAGVDTVSALHLASALELRRELDGFVTYQSQYASAARNLRLPVAAPA